MLTILNFFVNEKFPLNKMRTEIRCSPLKLFYPCHTGSISGFQRIIEKRLSSHCTTLAAHRQAAGTAICCVDCIVFLGWFLQHDWAAKPRVTANDTSSQPSKLQGETHVTRSNGYFPVIYLLNFLQLHWGNSRKASTFSICTNSQRTCHQ